MYMILLLYYEYETRKVALIQASTVRQPVFGGYMFQPPTGNNYSEGLLYAYSGPSTSMLSDCYPEGDGRYT